MDEVNFLSGNETIKEWRTKVDFEDDRLEFQDKDINVQSTESEGAKLELVGTWKEDDVVYLVEKEVDVSSDGANVLCI